MSGHSGRCFRARRRTAKRKARQGQAIRFVFSHMNLVQQATFRQAVRHGLGQNQKHKIVRAYIDRPRAIVRRSARGG